MEPSAQTLWSQGLRLNFVDWGNPSAPTLLLVHGGEDHCRSWDWIAQRFRADWHVVALDLRGHGDSDWSNSGDYSIAGYLSDVAALIEHLGPVTLVGHSLGGIVGLRYAGLFPELVRRVVSIEGVGHSPQVLQQRHARSTADALRHWLAERTRLGERNERTLPSLQLACDRLHARNPYLTKDQAWHLTRHAVRMRVDGRLSWKFDYRVRARVPYDLSLEEVASLWAQIACPTLLIWGARSPLTSPADDGRLSHFRQARIECVEGAGHWVQHERLDAVSGLLAAHLAR